MHSLVALAATCAIPAMAALAGRAPHPDHRDAHRVHPAPSGRTIADEERQRRARDGQMPVAGTILPGSRSGRAKP